MEELDEFEDPEEPVPPTSEPTLDDTGELDYEPSEPSANSIKGAVSDDEEEGETVDSDHEQQCHILSESADIPGEIDLGQSADDEELDVIPNRKGEDDEFSGPEEGEVDELEEGEVKDESDGGSGSDSDSDKGVRTKGDRMKPRGNRDDHPSTEPKIQHGDQQQRSAPAAAQSPTSAQDGKQSGDGRPEDNGVCKFYLRGQCTWGSFCKFMHPAGDRPATETEAPRRSIDPPAPIPTSAPVPLMALKAELPPPPPSMSIIRGSSPPTESAWERGLKQARERIKRATEKREIDPDFERKRVTMPLGVGHFDDTPSPIAIDQPSPVSRAGPRPLMDFGRSSDRYADEGPIGRQQYGRDPHYGDHENGSRSAYERRQPPSSMGRGRDTVNESYSRQQPISMQPRRGESQDRYYGGDRRDTALGSQQLPVYRERQNLNRDDYQAANIGAHRSSQDVMSPQQPYQRHSTSSSTDLGGQQYQERRPVAGDRDDRDAQRRRLEAEPQAYEYRRSPPPYYRDRDPDHGRSQGQDAIRRNNDERPARDTDIRRPPVQQSRSYDKVGHGDSNNQQQSRPPNYHYYRTLQQQHQNRSRNRVGEQERKPGSDNNREREATERTDKQPRGRNEYNFHFYNTRDRQTQQQQSGGRPLPYERPSFTRQDQQGQWRDPWRRSTSPGRRGSGVGGGENRHSSQSKRTPSRESNSPAAGDGLKKRRRRGSGSSSVSGSSASSRSSGDSVKSSERQGRAPRLHSGTQPGKKETAARRVSAGSSSGDSLRRRDQMRQLSNSPVDSGRGSRYDRYKRSSKERSPLRGRKETSDVVSRATAKALGSVHERSVSPYGDGSPRATRRAGSTSGRRSSAGSKNSGALPRDHRHQPPSPTLDQSPESGGRLAETRPLSPPPPAPFLATAVRVSGKGSEKMKTKHGSSGQQRTEPPRQPIKMTIANKSKVRTNIYDRSDDESDPAIAPPAEIGQVEKMSSPARSPSTPPEEEGPAPKKMKPGPDSEGNEGDSRVVSRREELLRQLRAVEHAIDAKRSKDKPKP